MNIYSIFDNQYVNIGPTELPEQVLRIKDAFIYYIIAEDDEHLQEVNEQLCDYRNWELWTGLQDRIKHLATVSQRSTDYFDDLRTQARNVWDLNQNRMEVLKHKD